MDGMMGGGSTTTGEGGPIDLLDLEVSGEAVATPAPVPTGPELRDLRQQPVAARRTLEFAMGMGGAGGAGGGMRGGRGGGMMSFTINGREFDPDRTDTAVASGTVEEWTLTNPSPMDHPIHLHVWPMQVIEASGRDLREPTWQDVVNIPAGGQVKVLVAFDIDGRTVYHCHILDHEDLGMMGTIQAR
jgi:FtsP/CotA-like multicopper oxidase with cupredoxin domain